MLTTIQKYNIRYFWHFTDRSNLCLIQETGGILSIAEISRRNLYIPAPGGNQWSHDADRYKGLDDYVHLALIDDHPMLFIAKQEERIKDPVWLQIKSSIALSPGVLFTSDVSNKSGIVPMHSAQAAKAIDFEVLFTKTNWKDADIKSRRKFALKSEILIPKIIPYSEIISIKNG